jgi:hypothetical protein
MADNKIYYNSGFLNKVKEKKSEKAPDYRSSIQLDDVTIHEILATGGKVSIAGWNYNDTVRLVLSADTYVKPAQENAKSNGYQPQTAEELEEDIPF